MVNFDGDPTADSEQYNKLERPVRDECESRVSYVSSIFLCPRISYLIAMPSLIWVYLECSGDTVV